ncbi:MAG: hypothetical protein ACOCX0_03690, partial [Bacteroidota bacterium]
MAYFIRITACLVLFTLFTPLHFAAGTSSQTTESHRGKKQETESSDKNENIVFYHGFEEGMPSGWLQEYLNYPDGFEANWDVRTGAGIVSGTYPGDPDTAAVGNKNLAFQWQSIGHVTRIITPPIDLEFIVNPVLSFYHAQAEWDPGHYDNLIIYYRKGETGTWNHLASYMHPAEVWTHRSIPLEDHDTDKFYLALEGTTGWGFGVLIDEFTITETGVIPKELDSFTTEQASLNFVPTASVNNPILRSTLRVTGNTGNINLEKYVAHSLNTDDANISNIKLYYTVDEHFSTTNLIAQAEGFQNGVVTFNDLTLDLPTGYSYLWLCYDLTEDATHGNYADAFIPANGITIDGQTLPVEPHNPPGRRIIYESVFYDDFDTDKGWVLTGEWERAEPTGLGGSYGNPGPSHPFVGTKILGTDITGLGAFPGDYEPSLDTIEYVAISPSINCYYYKDVTLSFHRWLNMEGSDKAWIHISTDEGETWETVWVNNNFFNAVKWSQQTSLLEDAYRQPHVRIRFGLGPTDHNNNYSGWNIDNLVITGTYISLDAGITQWIGPDEGCAMEEEETIVVMVENFGAEHINEPVPLGFSIDGGQTWHMDTLYQVIPVGESVQHTFLPKADFSTPGRYDVAVKIFWENDQDDRNDTLNHSVFSIPLIAPPYSELFLTSDGLWTGYGENSSWQWGTPQGEVMQQAQSGSNAWFTGLTGNYAPLEASWLESPCFDFSAMQNPALEFYLHVHTPEGTDGAALQYTDDNGASWHNLSPATDTLSWGWSDESEITSLQTAFGTEQGWHGTTEGWQRVRAVLGPEIAQQENIRFRMIFASHDFVPENSTWEGIGFDSFSLFEAPDDVGVVAIAEPLNGCELSQEQSVTVSVRNFGLNSLPAGTIIPLGLEIDTLPGAYENFTLEEDLHPDATANFTFETVFNMSHIQTYPVRAFTMLPGDNDFYQPGVYNDTLLTDITVFGYPEYALGNDIYTQQPDTVIIDAGTGFVNYLWQDGTTGQHYTVSSPHSGFYTVTVTDTHGCSATDSLEVIARDMAVHAITAPESSCELTDNEFLSVRLVNTGPDPFSQGTTIPISIFYNGEIWDETILTLENEFLPGNELEITFSNEFDFSQVGEYAFMVLQSLQDAGPSNDTLHQSVFVHGYPEPNIGDTIYTQDPESITLDAGENYEEYLWQDGHAERWYELSNPFSAWYHVTVTDEHGCPGTDSVLVVTYDIDIAELLEPAEACELTESESVGVRLVNHGPESFETGRSFPLVLEYQGELISEDTLILAENWNAGEEIDFWFSPSVNMTDPQSYAFRIYQKYRDANTLNDTLTFTVVVHGYPDIYLPPFISSDTPQDIVLDPGQGYASYLWHDGSTAPTYQVQTWGEHWVEVSNSFGCISTAQTYIYPEVLDIAVDSVVAPAGVCTNNEENEVKIRIRNAGYIPIEAGTSVTLWYGLPDGQSAQETIQLTNDLAPQTTSIYTFQQTFSLPADESHTLTTAVSIPGDMVQENDTLMVSYLLHEPPQPSLGDDIYTQNPLSLVLSTEEEYAAYLWQDGSTGSEYVVQDNHSATYSVTVTDQNGCQGSDAIEVVTYNLVMDSIISPRSYCVLTDAEAVRVRVFNEGYDQFEVGQTITLGFLSEGQPEVVHEDFLIGETWQPNTFRYFDFTQTADLSTGNLHHFKAFVATP